MSVKLPSSERGFFSSIKVGETRPPPEASTNDKTSHFSPGRAKGTTVEELRQGYLCLCYSSPPAGSGWLSLKDRQVANPMSQRNSRSASTH